VEWAYGRFVGVWDADVVERIGKPSQENLCIHGSLKRGTSGSGSPLFKGG
jgi:hypothetical protein